MTDEQIYGVLEDMEFFLHELIENNIDFRHDTRIHDLHERVEQAANALCLRTENVEPA